MGGSSWSDDAAKHLYTKVRPTMAPSAVFTSTAKAAIDPSLDPKGVKFRESCDSDAHPESNAIAIFFDVTGSMGGIPRTFAMEKLPSLMSFLLTKGYIEHPQVFFGAIGDAYTDRAPLQVGQFESGLEMDDCLTKIYLEGAGGGQNTESYDLALYFAARHMKLDCLSKRGKKGYLFLMGDEAAYPKVSRDQVERIIGEKLEADIPLETIIEEVKEKFEVFFIAVSSHGYADGHYPFWNKLFNERALKLDNADHVCELIGTTIGACEGRDLDDVHADLLKAGADPKAADAARTALVPYAAGRTLVKGTVSGDLAPVTGAPAGTVRL